MIPFYVLTKTTYLLFIYLERARAHWCFWRKDTEREKKREREREREGEKTENTTTNIVGSIVRKLVIRLKKHRKALDSLYEKAVFSLRERSYPRTRPYGNRKLHDPIGVHERNRGCTRGERSVTPKRETERERERETRDT